MLRALIDDRGVLTIHFRPLGLLIVVISWMGLLTACAASDDSLPPQQPTASPTPIPLATATPAPTATAESTRPPVARKSPTLSPEQALPFLTIQDMALACDELHPNRRRTVLQHMEWLVNSDDIPAQFNNLYGNNVQGQLAFGAVYMVAVQWKLNGRQPDSCLIPIGERLNTMTGALGKEPVPEFGFAAP